MLKLRAVVSQKKMVYSGNKASLRSWVWLGEDKGCLVGSFPRHEVGRRVQWVRSERKERGEA